EKTLKSAMGLDRSEVYITNIVKYRPPDNRDPLPAEIEACAGWLNRQITVICPEIICTLGRFSLAKFIPDVSISRVHGQPRFVNFENHRYVVFPMYHPAAALRAGSVLRDFEVDFRKLNDMLITPVGKSLPEITPDALNIQTSLF
ncbi:MAG: Phage SPO1 DNA polymerase-related protein, partial [Candidatus Amesbacteria bacterium GW2011_GWC1_46_24]